MRHRSSHEPSPCQPDGRIAAAFLAAMLLAATGRATPGEGAESLAPAGTNAVGPVFLSVVLEAEHEKSSVRPPEGFDEANEVAEMARFIVAQNPAEQRHDPVKFVRDSYAQMAKDPLLKDLPSALVPPYSGSSGHPCHYFVFLPAGYPVTGDPGARKWPLMVFLHGAGGNMRLALWTLLPAIRNRDYLVVFPSYLNGTWWTPVAGKFFHKVMADVKQRFAVDPARLVIAGCSNGATGAWALSKANSREFRAVVSISGAFDGHDTMMPTRGPPVYIVHGAEDKVIDPKFSRAAAKGLARNRPGTVYTELPEEGHLIFFSRNAEIMTGAFEWLAKLPAPAQQ